MICPYYKNREVFEGFNELIESLGGRPMTEDEFRSSALRDKRTGLDFYAMQAAYKIYNQNGGNFLNYTPTGEVSNLFNDILSITQDRKQAIAIKAQFYNESFRKNVINWVDNEGNILTAENVDLNGEPLLNFIMNQKPTSGDTIINGVNVTQLFALSTPANYFGEDFTKTLFSGGEVSSKDILQKLIIDGKIPNSLSILSEVLVKHDVPVTFATLPEGKLMRTLYSQYGIVIQIDPSQIGRLPQYITSKYFLHELVHSVTLGALHNPKTEYDVLFKGVNDRTYNLFKKAFSDVKYNEFDSDSSFYILKNSEEFAAVFATDKDARLLLYKKAYEDDKNNNNKLLLLFKKFTNTLSRFLCNKNLFNLKSDQLKLYLKNLNKYLNSYRPIVRGNINSEELYKAVYNSIDNNILNNIFGYQSAKSLSEQFDYFSAHYIEESEGVKVVDKNSKLWKIREEIADALQMRVAAINSSNVGPETKLLAKNVIEPQLKQLRDPNINTITILSSIINQAAPQLFQDVEAIKHVKETSASEYMYNMHDNFGTYVAMFENLSKYMQNDEVIKELAESFKQLTKIDKLTAIKDINDLNGIVQAAAKTAKQGVDRMFYILMNNIKRDVGNIAEKIHFPDTQRFLDSLEEVGFDTSQFMQSVGAKDGAKDDTIRTLVYLINKANRSAEEDVYHVSVRLLNAAKQLSAGESMLDLYELDENGRTTGYLVRSKNYGVFYNEYKKFLEDLNQRFGLPKENRKAPSDREKRIQYNKEKNKWLGENAIRRYKPEYYAAYAELSDDTLYQMQLIRDAIYQLKQKAKNPSLFKDNYYHYELLSPGEWKRLKQLYIHKRLLSKFVDINGYKKMEGSDEYRWAEEIQRLNETLYKNVDENNKAVDAWKKARKDFIKQSTKKHTTADGVVLIHLIKKDLEEWDSRNSKRRFKMKKVDGENKMEVFLQIDDELHLIYGSLYIEPVYEYNGDGGKTYRDNVKQMNEYLSIFRDYNTGEVDIEIMPAGVQTKYIQLQQLNSKIVKQWKKDNPELEKKRKVQAKTRKKLFNKYLKNVESSYYKNMYIDDDDLLDIDDDDEYELPKWCTKLVIRDGKDENGVSYKDKFTELVPGDGWINTDDRTDLKDERFELYEDQGVSMVPADLPKYSNKTQYDRIMNSPALRNLYNVVSSIIKEANGNMYNRLFQDDYLLPLISGSMFKYMKNKGMLGAAQSAAQYVADEFGLTRQGIEQTAEFGSSLTDVLLLTNDLDEVVQQEGVSYNNKTTGVRADGRQFNIIPQYYTKKLEDPSQISSDLLGIVAEYYKNSARFKYKSEIKDLAESLVDMIENRTYKKKNKRTGSVNKIRGVETGTYKAAKKFLEMNLYNIRSQSTQVNIGSTEVNVNKIQQEFSKLTTALNLGMSPAVAATGLFTASYSHLINSLVGDRGYGTRELLAAGREVLYHTFLNGLGFNYISNQRSEDKIMALAEFFNISNQLERKTKHSNRSRFARFFDHAVFGFLSSADFIIKSQIMVSELMSYRLVDGKFVSKEDIKNKYVLEEDISKEAEELKKWNEGVCLYSIFDVKEGGLIVDERYKQQFDAIKDLVYFRIIKTAENADGMATETQKAAITTNFLGASVMMHRQYFPLMVQQRTSEMVYDMDTNLMVQGQYQTIIKTLKLGLTFLRDRNAAKEEYNKLFNDKSSKEAALKSRARKLHIKKTIAEITIFNLLVSPLIGLLAAYADGDDKKDELALQLAVYIARRTEWEIYTPYRVNDAFNNFKTVTAQTGTIDKALAVWNSLSKWVSPQFSLLDTLFSTNLFDKYDPVVLRGVYKDWYKLYRDLFKLTPAHNLYEQWYGAKNKRKYYENQIMQLEK